MKKLLLLLGFLIVSLAGFSQPIHIYPAVSPGHALIGNTSGIATDTPFVNSLPFMQMMTQWVAAQGDTAVSFVANYKWNTIDSVPFYYTTSGSGTENGGWLTLQLTGGDSVKLNVATGVVIGASLVAGHPWRNGRLEGVNLAFQDSLGQITYYLSQYSHFQWINQGIGGQGTVAVRPRFMRDAIGQIATVNDTRGSQTLTHKPSVIIIFADLALNDIYANVPLSTIEQNFLWMAEQCMENNIPCIITNCIGESGSTPAQLLAISQFNKWLGSGVMNQYQVPVFDINSIWNSGTLGGISTTGNDNYHFSSLVNSGDGVHFTQAGYDSVAQWMIRTLHLPVLTKIAVTTALNPTSPIANYNRPANITFSGQQTGTIAGVPVPFTMPNNAFDTLTLTGTSVIVDTGWFRILTTVNVTGTSTQTGVSNISFLLTNNPTGQIWYSPPTFNGATIGNQNSTSLTLINDRYQASTLLDIQNTDLSSIFRIKSNIVGNTSVNINDITNVGVLGGAIVSIHAPAITAINTNGSIIASGLNSQLGSLQIGGNTAATGTGFGIMLVGSALMFNSASSANIPTVDNTGLYRFEPYTTLNFTTSTANLKVSTLETTHIYGNSTGSTDTLAGWTLYQTENDSIIDKLQGAYNGISIYHNAINLGVQQLWGFRNNIGFNFLNTQGGATSIGDSSMIQMHGSAMLAVNSKKRGFLPPSMTSAQRDSIGYVKSITITAGGTGYTTHLPKAVFTGGFGTGARAAVNISGGAVVSVTMIDKGLGYGGGSAPTLTMANTTGTGATFTVNMSGADSGLIIFNSTIDSLQYYNGIAWLDIGAGGGSTPTLQQVLTAGSNITSSLNINAGANLVNFTGSNPGVNYEFTSGLSVNGLSISYVTKGTNYTATTTDNVIQVNASGVTITLPVLPTGQIITIKNVFAGTASVSASGGNIDASSTYSLSAQYKYVTVVSGGAGAYSIIANN